MFRSFFALIVSFALFQATALADGWVHYGAKFTQSEAPLAAKDVLADPSSFTGKTILVEARVADVCQKAGCWMVIAEGDKSMRVLTKEHNFFVAKDGAGSTCRIEGVINAKEIDPETVAHFEEESTEKAIIPEKQVEGNMTYEFVATGISLRPNAK